MSAFHSASPLILTLTGESKSGHFTLSWESSSYLIKFRPEMDVMLRDQLRRLHPVLAGDRDYSKKQTPDELLHAVGIRLWQALLPDTAPLEMREALERELGIGTTPLLLVLPPNLSVLPWELLCDPRASGETGFLARRRPLARLLSGGPNLPPLAAPLRTLLLISSPPGLSEKQRLDVESERSAIESATYHAREAGLLHLLVEDIVTPRRVQQVLLRFKPHLVHYIGHGDYDEEAGGYLIWEDEQGEPFQLFGTQFTDLLRSRGLRVVLLHGCQTATSGARTEFRSIAGALLDAGIPAVLAQQASFTYESSQRASEMFYTALTSGLGIVEATFEARQALLQADRPDWAVSVLQVTAGGLIPLIDESAPSGPSDPMLAQSGFVSNLPAPTGIFVGRQRELRALRAMLGSAPGTGPVLALITGPGGIGKSTLAAQAIARYGRQYKAALTLDCTNYQGIDRFLQRIGEFLQRQGMAEFLEDTFPQPKLSMAAKIEEAIAALNQVGSFLLVIENLEHTQEEDRSLHDANLLQLLQKLLTNLQVGRVLVTGRYVVEGLLPKGKFSANLLRLDLGDLSNREVQQLLIRHPPLAQLSSTTRTEIVREFGGLPYVYDLLSSRAATQNLDSLIQDVQGRITRRRELRTGVEWEDIRQRIVEFTALESIVARLPQEAYRLLGKLSVFLRPFPLQALEQGLAATPLDWQPLLDWGLLGSDSVHGTYRLHSLTAKYAERILDAPDLTTAQAQVAEWYLRYAEEESHSLDDYLEAYRLLRTAGKVEQASELVIDDLAPALEMFGMYQLGYRLCTTVLEDIRDPYSSLTDSSLTAAAKRWLGVIAREQGEYEEACRWLGESLAICEQLDDQKLHTKVLRDLGIVAWEQGHYEEARRWLGESLAICEQLDDQGLHASILQGLGMVVDEQGDYEKARQFFNQALNIYRRLDHRQGYAVVLLNLGNIAQIQGHYAEAQQLYDEALPIFKQSNNRHGYASIQHQLGIIAEKQGHYEDAQRFYSEALTTFEQLGIQRGRIDTLAQLGSIAYKHERYEEAWQFYHESLSLSKQLGNLRGQGTALKGLASIAKDQQRYNEAQQFYSESLAISEQIGDLRLRANILYDLGDIAEDQQRYNEAQQHYSEALTIYGHLGILYKKGPTLHHLGNIAREQQQYEEAQRFYSEALSIYKQLDDLDGQADILYELGHIAQEQQQYEEAQRFYSEALSIYKQLDDLNYQARILSVLGNIAQEQKRYEEAQQFYEESLTLSEQLDDLDLQARILSNLGNIAQEQQQYEEAQRFYSEALSIYKQLDDLNHQAGILAELGNIAQEQKRYEEAQQFYEESLTLSEQLDNQEQCTKLLTNLGVVAQEQGHYNEAEQFYNEALTLMPNRALLHRNHAQMLIYARRLEEAEADLSQSVALDGHENSPYLWERRAQIAIARGDGLLADQMLNEALRREASHDVAFLLMQAAWLQGKLHVAQEIFQREWKKASLRERALMRDEMECLFNEHPQLNGINILQSIMKSTEQ